MPLFINFNKTADLSISEDIVSSSFFKKYCILLVVKNIKILTDISSFIETKNYGKLIHIKCCILKYGNFVCISKITKTNLCSIRTKTTFFPRSCVISFEIRQLVRVKHLKKHDMHVKYLKVKLKKSVFSPNKASTYLTYLPQ